MIKFICGRICSGKDTYVSQRIGPLSKKVVVSDVVKTLSGLQKRSNLSKQTKHLDKAIAQKILEIISTGDAEVEDYYIVGIRQPTILTSILPELANFELIWLEVPFDIRKERFAIRADTKDDLSFEELEALDNELGLEDLENLIKFDKRTRIIQNH